MLPIAVACQFILVALFRPYAKWTRDGIYDRYKLKCPSQLFKIDSSRHGISDFTFSQLLLISLEKSRKETGNKKHWEKARENILALNH